MQKCVYMYTVRTRFYTNVYIVLAQSLEVSKIKKNKKTSKNFGHLPLFIIDDQNFSKFSYFFFIFETSSDCGISK